MAEKPLFIPLCTAPYEAFECGGKRHELRLYGPRWNEKTCRIGREVLLSKGYGPKYRLRGAIRSFEHKPAIELCSTHRIAVLTHFGTLDKDIAMVGIDVWCPGCQGTGEFSDGSQLCPRCKGSGCLNPKAKESANG